MLTFQTLPARHVSEFAAAVREGLLKPGQRELPSKYLYDEVGSALFEAICLLPEYGLTRADARLLQTHAQEIVDRLPSPIHVAELGSAAGKRRAGFWRPFRVGNELIISQLKSRPQRWQLARRSWDRLTWLAWSDTNSRI